MNKHDELFEEATDKSVLAADLIDQIFKLEVVINTHRQYGDSGPGIQQYLQLKAKFTNQLQQLLAPLDITLSYSDAA